MASNPIIPSVILVLRLLQEQRDALENREEAQLKRLAALWFEIENSLLDEMILLAQQIQDEKAKGSIITEQLIRRMQRFQQLNENLREKILELARNEVTSDIAREQLEFMALGLEGASDTIKVLAPGLSFRTVSMSQLEDLAGLLADGSPLYKLLQEAYPDALDGIIKGLLEGTAKGLGPVQVATMMAQQMGLGLDRLILIARTEQLRAWRTSTAKQYEESGVVLYSLRVCAHSIRTCMACLLAEGEIIPLGEVLSDHPRGRCTTIPVVKGAEVPQWKQGEQWFLEQTEAVQKEMLGPGMYNLWKEEEFDLEILLGRSFDEVYGSAPRVKTLTEVRVLLGIAS
jgi:hypothetical protein